MDDNKHVADSFIKALLYDTKHNIGSIYQDFPNNLTSHQLSCQDLNK